MEQVKPRRKMGLIALFIVLLLFFTAFRMGHHFVQSHFLYNTKIEGVSCSLLSIDEGIEQVNQKIGEEVITLCFINGKTYNVSAKQFGMRADEAQMVRIFDQQHLTPDETREYNLDGFFLADEKLIREFLKKIPELQEDEMITPQNAYIVWDENAFSIEKEVLGNEIDFEEAVSFVLEKLKNGENQIDFSKITHQFPEILAEDLVSEKNELNLILSSSINFELSNGDLVILDSNIIKNWVYQDENGKYNFDIENGVSQFVEDLAARVNEANSIMHFAATDTEGLSTVNVPWNVRAQLDKESEIAEIKSLLGNPEPVNKKPVYDRKLISDMLTSYIEIDLSRQYIWFYKDGELIMQTPCVTGNVRDGYGTPTGVFFLLNKNRKVYLEGFNKDGSEYSAFVEYWMRFNQGIGMHDAQWRYKFGGTIYKSGGSHGCVNMPKDAAAVTYEHIDETMPIIVYQSET